MYTCRPPTEVCIDTQGAQQQSHSACCSCSQAKYLCRPSQECATLCLQRPQICIPTNLQSICALRIFSACTDLRCVHGYPLSARISLFGTNDCIYRTPIRQAKGYSVVNLYGYLSGRRMLPHDSEQTSPRWVDIVSCGCTDSLS